MVAMNGNPSPSRARALALAAVRETFEEAGLLIGTPAQTARRRPSPRPGRSSSRTASARRWRQLTFFARAITPPGRPRRFDTRFFCVPADAIVHKIAIADGELSDLEWHSIAQARSAGAAQHHAGSAGRPGRTDCRGCTATSDLPVPFYHRRNGEFVIAT